MTELKTIVICGRCCAAVDHSSMDDAPRRVAIYRNIKPRAPGGRFYVAVQNAELACEVTLQPLRRYPLDAAILFPISSPCQTRWV